MVNNNLVGGWPTPLKNISSSVGMMTFPIYGKIKFMFQTTNQPFIFHENFPHPGSVPIFPWYSHYFPINREIYQPQVGITFRIKRSSTGVPMPHRCDSTSHSGPVPCRWSGRVCHTCHHSVSGRGLKVLGWKRGFVQWLVTGGNHLQKMDYQAATNYLTNFTAHLSMVYHHLFPFFDA